MTSSTVAEYLAHQLRVCGMTQKQVAEAAGFPNPNVISMMKRGQTKVPLDKVPALARALGVDPAHFLRIVMLEYTPENWKAVQEALGFVLSRNERELIEGLRIATGNTDPRIDPTCLAGIGKSAGARRIRRW